MYWNRIRGLTGQRSEFTEKWGFETTESFWKCGRNDERRRVWAIKLHYNRIYDTLQWTLGFKRSKNREEKKGIKFPIKPKFSVGEARVETDWFRLGRSPSAGSSRRRVSFDVAQDIFHAGYGFVAVLVVRLAIAHDCSQFVQRLFCLGQFFRRSNSSLWPGPEIFSSHLGKYIYKQGREGGWNLFKSFDLFCLLMFLSFCTYQLL